MADQIIYALVARGSNVLAEYTDRTGNFEQVTRQLLNKIPVGEDNKMSYVYPKEKFVFHYIVERGITYLCMADEGFGRSVPFRFLEDIKTKFYSQFGDRARTAHAYALNADFQHVIRKQMEIANDPMNLTYRSTDGKIMAINEEIESAKSTVLESIEKVLDRGERIELLVHKSDALNEHSVQFNTHARRLKNRMLWKNVKMSLLLFFIVAVIIYIILGIVCGFTFKQCS